MYLGFNFLCHLISFSSNTNITFQKCFCYYSQFSKFHTLLIITFSFSYLFSPSLFDPPLSCLIRHLHIPHNTSFLLPPKFCITFVFNFSCEALIVLWAISGYHSHTYPFPPPPKKKKNSKHPFFLAGCQHLIRTLLLVIEVN